MKIAIVGAMEEEVEILRREIGIGKITTIANCEFIEGKVGKHEVIVTKSGIGKVNAAMATTILLQNYKPDIVLNTGSAGGTHPDLEVGTIVISDYVLHHDVDVTAFGYELGQVPQLPATFPSDKELINLAKETVTELDTYKHAVGTIASADVFMSDADRVLSVKEKFPRVIAVEMEAAAVAQVCYQFNTKFVVIRALSDIAGKESSISFDEFLPLAAKHSSQIVLRVISKL
ncbi:MULTISPECIES: 5'-methylthioadenosine/S-adenosylhomocysteine nucleosidase [Sporosarcina]|uniref:5'-methylthioadenosine/S-adenosylhomocysteine nucleosidase n=2 Tax=Sporosarcina newyorkensis TaxID=759851 RepID=A0A1T4XFI5_9BACL|nr:MULTISPECIES: 5'-methylthioadenosine/S-adenosylhomocysteine nucleosidase [Sporosarcina]EGQ27613.1 5'-methylthioadenosine/S-adenosylhomocysteine nucleosidase [Sporosarcina newyorkensis 2681]MBY0220994.1 5'-methylthioadenosine/S-adenosylhomocysteine nucleosidase [Sporosarcina aquimarina]SKA87958.1 adenosylhomocysteine nucleosidase [Sporosarcina newyorkensis]